ncbi:hypothetical protein QNH18_16870 [Bacillus paralicheniformis]|uniref:hypothetical protein n=1 Tax=Bacillus paralicheniformis TaxID=1648923 RepID=UPI0024C14FA9|nr:hypothetical protein [Bacillus paralicheniformis]WHX85820.1 hypothetical protein QNH18_16870 [Bacillus paralicheniformis]
MMMSVVKAKVIDGWNNDQLNRMMQDFIDECVAEGLSVDVKNTYTLTAAGPVLIVAYREAE